MGKLVKDWFNRRAEDAYTFADDSKRFFSWDSGRSSYSSYFIRNNDSMKEAAKMVGSMFRVIGVPKQFKYTSETRSKEATHAHVQVPLAMLRDEDGYFVESDPALLDAFYGAAIQNAALATMQTTSEYVNTVSARDTSRKTSVSDLLFSVLNTERIDKKLADRLPGYLKFVQKFKDYKYENAEALPEDAPAQQRLMDLIVKMLRYPANISETDLEEFEKPIQSIERLLKKHGGIPATFEDCQAMGRSLANIIYKYTEEEETPPGGGGEDDGSSDDSESDGGSGSGSSAGKPRMSRNELDDLARSMMDSLVNAEEGDSSDEEFMSDFEDFTEDMGEKSLAKMDHSYHEEGDISEGTVYFKKGKSDKEVYKHALAKIDVTKAAVLQKLFQRKSKDHAFVMKSMRSGRLDTNKIAEARQNVPTIYERIGRVTTNKICVGVLIDESGSMGGSRIQKAREAAIFINEVFKKMPDVDLYIYGHTADIDGPYTTRVNIYREKKSVNDPFALGAVDARSQNRDGDAILATAKRMRGMTPDQGILFVISDGQPAAGGYSGRAAIEDTRKKVQKAQSLGFQVIQIAIDECVPSKEMFDYFIKMTDIKNLPKDMVAYMSRKVDKMIKETVTL